MNVLYATTPHDYFIRGVVTKHLVGKLYVRSDRDSTTLTLRIAFYWHMVPELAAFLTGA